MEFVGLVSGGKDSIFSIARCISEGHKLIGVLHLSPPQKFEELNSYMYQTVGSEIVEAIAEALGVPIMIRKIAGKPKNLELEYGVTAEDEVEDLFELVKEAKNRFPNVKAVSSGAILSSYQKKRVENVCERLGLVSLAPLWQMEQKVLLREIVDYGIKAMLVRVCADGLTEKDLGKYLHELEPRLLTLEEKRGVHCCGEGGEFETIVLDSPIFLKRIEVEEMQKVVEIDNGIQYVGRIAFRKFRLVDK